MKVTTRPLLGLFFIMVTIALLSIAFSLMRMAKRTKFIDIPGGSFVLDGIVDDKYSEPFACNIGKSVVEIVEIKNGLKYFKLHGKGILINSKYIHKTVHENPDILWTVPESSPLQNGSTLALHVFKSERNADGSRPIDFYVPYRYPSNQVTKKETR